MAVANIAVSITARTDKFARGMQKARGSLARFGQQVKQSVKRVRILGTSLKTLAGIGGIALAGRAFVGAARQLELFDRAMRKSQAIMGDLSDTMRNDMRRAAIEVSRTTTFAAREAADAFFFLASAGLSARQSIEALPVVAKFATAGAFDLARATDLLTDAQSALGLTVKDAAQNMANMARVGDVLVKANTLANASVEQFSEALTNKAGPALRILGKSVEEGVAVLAVLADQGIKAANAGQALDIVLREVVLKSLANTKQWEKFSIAVFDANRNVRNIADILRDLERALLNQSDAGKSSILMMLGFTAKSVSFIKALVGTSDKLREMNAALLEAGGTMDKVASRQLTPLQQAMGELRATFIEMSAPLTAFIEGLAKLGKTAARVFRTLTLATLRLKGLFDITTPAKQFGRISDITGEIVFISEQEERTITRIAKRFEQIQQAAAKRAQDEKDAANALSRQRNILIELGGEGAERFRKMAQRVAVEIGDFGLDEAAIAMRELNKAFDEALGVIPVSEFNRVVGQIEEFAKQQKKAAEAAFLMESAFDKQMETFVKADRVFARTRTPLERFDKEMSQLEDLFARGILKGGVDTFNRAVAQLEEELKRATQQADRTTKRRVTFVEVSLARAASQPFGGQRGRPQIVKDPEAIRLLRLMHQAAVSGRPVPAALIP